MDLGHEGTVPAGATKVVDDRADRLAAPPGQRADEPGIPRLGILRDHDLDALEPGQFRQAENVGEGEGVQGCRAQTESNHGTIMLPPGEHLVAGTRRLGAATASLSS